MGSDVTRGETSAPDGHPRTAARSRSARRSRAYELWRIAVADGDVERLTSGRHYICGWDAVPGPRGRTALAAPALHADRLAGPVARSGRGGSARRLTSFNADVLAELELIEPVERRSDVDGRSIQGWFIPAGGRASPPPRRRDPRRAAHLYGWSPMWEFQILAANGDVACSLQPARLGGLRRGLQRREPPRLGPGPMRDVLAGVDALVADGLADPDRLGVTGGSYGGYLTNWIIGHDQRFAAAMTCRSVSDMAMLFLTGDISGGEWAARVRERRRGTTRPTSARSRRSPTRRIRTPLLIQHSERDLRHDGRPGRGAVHRRCARCGRSGSCACRRRRTS